MTDAPAGDERRPAASIEAVDRKLNVFALANGMDLERRGEARVLGWYRDAREREVRLEPGEGAGTWAVRAVAVPDARVGGVERSTTVESALAPDEILARFAELLGGAVDAANAIAEEGPEGRA